MSNVISKEPLIFSTGGKLIDDRIDPFYYHPDYMHTTQVLSRVPFEIRSLGEISISIQNFGAYALYNKIEYVEKGIPFLREGNIREGKIDMTNVKYIAPEHHELLKKSHVKPNSVLLTMTGNPGIAAFVPENFGDCNSNQHIAKIILKKNINPRYVSAFLNSKFGRSQVERMTTGTTHRHIFLYSIKSIKIPIPPKELQNRIAQIIKDARQKSQENIRKSDELLGKIETIVSIGLGLKLSKTELRNFMIIQGSDIEDRLDVDYYEPKYLVNMEVLKNSEYKLRTLGEISVRIERGVEPGSKAYRDKGVPFLRIQNILPYQIDFTDTVFIEEELYKNLRRYQIHPREVLFSKDATIGVSLVVPNDIGRCITSSGIARITLEENINPLFVSSFLNTSPARLQAERRSYGSVIHHLAMKELMTLKIPMPPKEIQDTIAEKVRNTLGEAEKLKTDAQMIVEKAKKQVEEIIKGKMNKQ